MVTISQSCRYIFGFALLLLVLSPWVAANNSLASELRFFQEGYLASGYASVGGKKLQSPAGVATFYQENQHVSIWTGGELQSARLAELLSEIKDSK